MLQEKSNIKVFIFDFDGTLVDSMPSFIKGVLKVLQDKNISYGDDLIKNITPLGLFGTAKYFVEKFNLEYSSEELVEIFKKNMYEDYFYRIPAKNNVIRVLKKLKNEGASLNVLTASPHEPLDACLKRLNLFELFDNVWSCDDFNTTKADVNIYKMAAKKLGKQVEEILFLDDNFFSNKTAKQANMKVCGVYDESSSASTEQIKEITDFFIYDFSELLELKF